MWSSKHKKAPFVSSAVASTCGGLRRKPSLLAVTCVSKDRFAADRSLLLLWDTFANQRALLVAAHPETEATSLLPPDAPDDPGERLDAVIAAFTSLIADTEAQQRTMLRLSLEPDAGEHAPGLLRQGRAIGWIEEALAPLRAQLPEPDLAKADPRRAKRYRNRGPRLAD